MEKNKLKKAIHIYNFLGKGLFACAIGCLGLMLGGPLLAAIGIIAGIIGGELLEKNITKLIKEAGEQVDVE